MLYSFTKLTFQVPLSLKAERTYTLDLLKEIKNGKNNKIVKLHIKRMFLLMLIYNLYEKPQSTIAYKIYISIIITSYNKHKLLVIININPVADYVIFLAS